MVDIKNHPEGYTILSNILNEEDIQNFKQYFKKLEYFNGMFNLDKEFTGGVSERYGDIVGESLLLDIQPIIEQVVAKKLLPTYSFQRIYHRDGKLVRHVDRPSCEISCTLTIDFDDKAPDWPIYIKLNNKEIPVILDKGEGLIYRGCDMEHWRNSFKGNYSIHIFLHYVDADGANTNYKNDKRSKIYGQKGFRKILATRLHTLELLDDLCLDTLIQPTIPISYKIKEKNKRALIFFDNGQDMEIPHFMQSFVKSLFQKSDSFTLQQIDNKMFDKLAFDLLRQFILCGYFKIISA